MVTILAVKRRTLVERRIIPLLRGERDSAVPTALRRAMNDLCRHARRTGLHILPAGSTYVGRDELALLGWLAGAQRVVPVGRASPDDVELAAAIRCCASALGDAGLHLSAFALYGSRDPRR